MRAPHALLPSCFVLGLAMLGCAPPVELEDPWVDLDAHEEALSLTCPGQQACTGEGAVYVSTYRVGVAPTSQGELVQTIVPTADGRPSKVFLIARSLRAFTAPTAPLLHVGVYGPITGDVRNTAFSAISPILEGTRPIASLGTGVTAIDLQGEGSLVTGETYAVRVTADGVGPSGSGSVLVGVGSIIESAYGDGAAYRGTQRSQVAWAPPAASRLQPAGSFDLAIAFGGADGSPCSADGDCSSGLCLSNVCTPPNRAGHAEPGMLMYEVWTGESGSADAIFYNDGNVPLDLTLAVDDEFSVTADGCTGSLAVGASCTVTVAFAPTWYGQHFGTLTFDSPDLAAPVLQPISGVAFDSVPEPVWSVQYLELPTTPVGETSTTSSVTITNNGHARLDISSITTSPGFDFTSTCSELWLGETCTIDLTMTSSTIGTLDGELTVTTNAGAGLPPLSIYGVAVGATATPSTSSLAFANTWTDHLSALQDVTFLNEGNYPFFVSSLTVSPPFAIASTDCTADVTPEASCTVSVRFEPTAAGTFNGTLELASTAIAGTRTIALSGTAQLSVPVAGLSATALSFTDRAPGTTSAAQVVTLTNDGHATLPITSIVKSGDYASTTTCGPSLAEGASCTISVTFTPTVLGARAGTITITDGAAGSPHVVTLSGNGVGATAGASPTSLSFPDTYANSLSAAQNVTISNTGNVTLTVSSVTASAQFSVSSNGCTTVAAAGSCVVGVKFSPTTAGAKSGTLTLVSNAMAGNTTVSLTGTALQSGLTPSSQADYVIATALGNPATPVNVTVTIAAGVVLTGSSNTTAALSTGALPAGSTVHVVNLGQILGGRTAGSSQHGGTALRITGNYDVTIDNSGAIYGAGGNGGRGGRAGTEGGLGTSAQGAATVGGTGNGAGGGAAATSGGGGGAGSSNWWGAAGAGVAGLGGNSCYLGNAPWAGGGDGYAGNGAGWGGGGGGCSTVYAGCGGGGFWGGGGGGGGLDNASNGGAWQYTVNGTRGGNGGAAIEIPAGYTGSIAINTTGGTLAGAVWNDFTGKYYTGSFTSLASTASKTPNAPAGITTWNNGVGIVYR